MEDWEPIVDSKGKTFLYRNIQTSETTPTPPPGYQTNYSSSHTGEEIDDQEDLGESDITENTTDTERNFYTGAVPIYGNNDESVAEDLKAKLEEREKQKKKMESGKARQVTFTHKARIPEELDVSRGDTVTEVLGRRAPEEYLYVTSVHGQTGLVPLNHVEEIQAKPSPRRKAEQHDDQDSPNEFDSDSEHEDTKVVEYGVDELTEEEAEEARDVLHSTILSTNPNMIKDRKNYNDCMVGSEMVDWIMGQCTGDNDITRDDAVGMWQVLLEKTMIRHVRKKEVLEDRKIFYKFVDVDLKKVKSARFQSEIKKKKLTVHVLQSLRRAGPDAMKRVVLQKPDRTLEDINIIFEILRPLKAVQLLTEDHQKDLAAVVHFVSCAHSGTQLYKKQDKAQCAYIILKGSVRLVKQKKTILNKGEVFGNSDSVRDHTVTTNVDNCHFLTVAKEHVHKLLNPFVKEKASAGSSDMKKRKLLQLFDKFEITKATRETLKSEGIETVDDIIGITKKELREDMNLNIGQSGRIMKIIHSLQEDEKDLQKQNKEQSSTEQYDSRQRGAKSEQLEPVESSDEESEEEEDDDEEEIAQVKNKAKTKKTDKTDGDNENISEDQDDVDEDEDDDDDDFSTAEEDSPDDNKSRKVKNRSAKRKAEIAANRTGKHITHKYTAAYTDKKKEKEKEKKFKHIIDSTKMGGLQKFVKYIKEVGVKYFKIKDDKVIYVEGNTNDVNGFTIHKLPLLITYKDDVNKIRKCVIGAPNQRGKHKTILMVGATGCGKSTMINGLVNYIYGMELNQKYRLEIIDKEEEEEKVSQTESQTEWITAYKITLSKCTQIDYNLTVVDMPGFGDTSGIGKDECLRKNIKAMFSKEGDGGLDTIDAVCFMAKADESRLTATQSYIFDSILSIFGEDIKDHIQILVSFATDEEPVVLNALQAADVPYEKVFKFNNAALFPKEGQFTEYFWKLGQNGFESFFTYLKHVEPKSLFLTKEVLKEREAINESVSDLQEKIYYTTVQIEKKDELKRKIKQKVKEMDEYKDFTKTYKEVQYVHKALSDGQIAYNCVKCSKTCYIPNPDDSTTPKQDGSDDDNDDEEEEADSDDEIVEKLTSLGIIDKRENCKICEGKCPWKKHIKHDFTYKRKKVKKSKVDKRMKQNYVSAEVQRQEAEETLKAIDEERLTLSEEVDKMVQDVAKCMKRLDQIALKKGLPSEIDYINMLIETERDQARPGFDKRVKALKESKRKLEILGSIAHNEDVIPKSLNTAESDTRTTDDSEEDDDDKLLSRDKPTDKITSKKSLENHRHKNSSVLSTQTETFSNQNCPHGILLPVHTYKIRKFVYPGKTLYSMDISVNCSLCPSPVLKIEESLQKESDE